MCFSYKCKLFHFIQYIVNMYPMHITIAYSMGTMANAMHFESCEKNL